MSEIEIVNRVSHFEGIADWYDTVMSDPEKRGVLNNESNKLLAELAGPGSGLALDIGCGTGSVSKVLRDLGYNTVGVDLAADQLRIAAERLPVAQADVTYLPIASGAVPLIYSTFTQGVYDDLQGVVNEIYRVLAPGGRYIDISTHPCFNGCYSERQPDGSVIQRPGYRSSHFVPPAHFNSFIRGRVGAWNRPLDESLNIILKAGFRLRKVAEGGSGKVPDILAIIAYKE